MLEPCPSGFVSMSFPPRLLKFCLRSGRRATATVALLVYLLAVVGVPLPAGPKKDRSQPFPCMDRPCGCKDAAQCWTSCCCTTPRERLAWARQRGIEPPSALAVLAIVRRGGRGRPSDASTRQAFLLRRPSESRSSPCSTSRKVGRSAGRPGRNRRLAKLPRCGRSLEFSRRRARSGAGSDLRV